MERFAYVRTEADEPTPEEKARGWVRCGKQWTFFHDAARGGLFNPSDAPDGPALQTLSNRRVT
eukprot:5464884-Alexandrium_andersonii.AAC.1